ncbi:MAG: hypothetical protein Q8O67_04615 [Deltaproteobacteria bacterium]|nr:hypothetical protein [Deltaproteobacteria bacterium]
MSLGGVNNKPEFSTRKLPELGSEAAGKAAETAAAKLQEAAKLEEAKPAGDFVDALQERQAADPSTVDGARTRALSGDAEAKARLLAPKDEGSSGGIRRGLRPDAEWQEARATTPTKSGGSTKPVPRPPPKPPGSTKLVENIPPPGTVDPNKPQLA